MKYIIHLECKEGPIHNYFVVTDSEFSSYYFWRCCHGCQMYIVVGASQSRKPTWRAGAFFLPRKVPQFDRPPSWLSLISQERKITDFIVLRWGLTHPPFPLKIWHSLEKMKFQMGSVFPVFPSSHRPHAGPLHKACLCLPSSHPTALYLVGQRIHRSNIHREPISFRV